MSEDSKIILIKKDITTMPANAIKKGARGRVSQSHFRLPTGRKEPEDKFPESLPLIAKAQP